MDLADSLGLIPSAIGHKLVGVLEFWVTEVQAHRIAELHMVAYRRVKGVVDLQLVDLPEVLGLRVAAEVSMVVAVVVVILAAAVVRPQGTAMDCVM